MWTDSAADVWVPLTLQVLLGYETNSSTYASVDRSQPWIGQDRIAWLNLFGRIQASERPRATALLQAANQQGLADMVQAFTDGEDSKEMLAHTLAVEPLAQGFSGLRAQFSDTLLALSTMVAIVLLVACANIANLLLTRAAGRARDVRIRLSLGATTSRLVRHYLTESLMLALAGGAVGLVAGEWASGFLAREVLNTSSALPPVFSPDRRVLLFTTAVSLATAMLFGLAPALRAIRIGRATGLVTNQRDAIGQSTMRGMRPLVTAQLALSVVVVFAAILLSRTLINLARLNPGFAIDRLVTVSFDSRSSGYPSDQLPALHQRLMATATNLPGVTSAALSACGLIRNCTYSAGFNVEDVAGSMKLRQNWISPGYFSTVGISLLNGREFNERDTAQSARVAIVSESIARRFPPGQSPIGKRLGLDKLDIEIVGVVHDVRAVTLHDEPVPMVYFPIEQPLAFRAAIMNLDLRVSGSAERAIPAVRQAIRAAEPALIVDEVGTMSLRIRSDVGRERLVTYLSTAFALLALFLASIGLYGVLSFAVAGRTREIGVRMALGARSQQVAWMVIGDALVVVAVGLLTGVLAAFATGRLLKTLLFGVSVSDPFAYALMIGVLTVTMLAAAYLPARRAARIDPTQALRAE
jgi:predicted permease